MLKGQYSFKSISPVDWVRLLILSSGHMTTMPGSHRRTTHFPQQTTQGWKENCHRGGKGELRGRIAARHGPCCGLDAPRPLEAGEIKGGPYHDTVRNYWVAFCVQDLRPLWGVFPKGVVAPQSLLCLLAYGVSSFPLPHTPTFLLPPRLKPKRKKVSENKPYFHF